MEEIIHLLEKEGLRDKVKVMIGGGPVSQNYADKIGADGYSTTAVEAVKLAKRLIGNCIRGNKSESKETIKNEPERRACRSSAVYLSGWNDEYGYGRVDGAGGNLSS